jgi:hypothetical protein
MPSTVKAIEYGSWPSEQPADQIRTRAARLGPGHKARQHFVTQMLKMMVFTEEAGEIGGEKAEHFPPLVSTLGGADQFAILPEAAKSDLAKTLGQPRVHQRGLGFVQRNASV